MLTLGEAERQRGREAERQRGREAERLAEMNRHREREKGRKRLPDATTLRGSKHSEMDRQTERQGDIKIDRRKYAGKRRTTWGWGGGQGLTTTHYNFPSKSNRAKSVKVSFAELSSGVKVMAPKRTV